MSAGKFRITRQRQIILEELRKVTSHPTADEIYELVRRRLPRISLSTVQRNLELLVEQDLVKIIQTKGAQRRYDGNTVSHHHIRCVRCGRVSDISPKSLPSLQEISPETHEYQVVGYDLEFTGICPSCAESAPKRYRKKLNSNT